MARPNGDTPVAEAPADASVEDATPTAESTPAETPTETAADAPTAVAAAAAETDAPPAADEATPSSVSLGDASAPVTVTWRGEMLLRPVGYTPDPSSERYVVRAAGRDIHLADQEAELTCRRLVFRHPQRAGELVGAANAPARLLMTSEQEIVCQRIRFDVDTAKIYLDGPGEISQPQDLSEVAETDQEADPTEIGGRAGSIKWAGTMVANIGEYEALTDTGETETRQFIEEAVFFDEVVLSQGPPEMMGDAVDPTGGDYVRCDVLAVWMQREAQGNRIAPESAIAEGNVSGRQAGSDMTAGKVTVWFDQVERISDTGEIDLQLRPRTVEAVDSVRIVDAQNERSIEATADRLVSDLQEKIAVLYGEDDPAVILHGDDRMIGHEIHLDQDRQSASVVGPGEMQFLIRSDMDGNELDTPRPMDIVWAEGMAYHGKTDMVTFTGEVELTSGLESVRCERLRLLFERAEEEPSDVVAVEVVDADAAAGAEDVVESDAAEDVVESDAAEDVVEGETADGDADGAVADAGADEEADGPAGRRMALDFQRYSNRRLTMIMAHGSVVLASREEDDQERLLRRLQLAGDQLMYDVTLEELTMAGPGSLMVEDYRPPARESGDDEPTDESLPGASQAMARPSQSAFQWTDRMRLSQDQRVVELVGRVWMDHRTGNQIVQLPGLRTQPMGRITDGRWTRIQCQRMLAEFGEPEPAEASDQAAEAAGDKYDVGPQIGPLERFVATRDVHLVDRLAAGDLHVRGQQLEYDRVGEVATVWGFLEGQPVANAELIYEAGESEAFSNPKIIFEMEGSTVKKVILDDDIYGHGTR